MSASTQKSLAPPFCSVGSSGGKCPAHLAARAPAAASRPGYRPRRRVGSLGPRAPGSSRGAMPPRGRRGPRRARDSCVKIVCAYKKCRSGTCVKNVSHAARAHRMDVNAALCRPLHPAAEVVRLCGSRHWKVCSARTLVARGQREGLDLEQYCLLFHALVRIGPLGPPSRRCFSSFAASVPAACARPALGGSSTWTPSTISPPRSGFRR